MSRIATLFFLNFRFYSSKFISFELIDNFVVKVIYAQSDFFHFFLNLFLAPILILINYSIGLAVGFVIASIMTLLNFAGIKNLPQGGPPC